MLKRNWLLPEHIADLLPQEAAWVEQKRRLLLDLFASYGYRLVAPPLLEYLDSLLTDANHDLALKTFKLVDQLSGRQLGLRADITPQVARIEAHQLHEEAVSRLCYSGSVAHTLPEGLMSSREPLLIGAELYGCANLAADAEILILMAQSLAVLDLPHFYVDLDHIGIVRALLAESHLNGLEEEALFVALQSKDLTSLRQIVLNLPPSLQQAWLALPNLYGGVEVLEQAAAVLPALPALQQALLELKQLVAQLPTSIKISIDLAENRVSHYHSGLVFAVYADGWANAIARGGRYDAVCAQFGRARAATGFSLDLRELLRVLPCPVLPKGILAPANADTTLQELMTALRQSGQIVLINLDAHPAACYADQCDREFVQIDGLWQVQALNK